MKAGIGKAGIGKAGIGKAASGLLVTAALLVTGCTAKEEQAAAAEAQACAAVPKAGGPDDVIGIRAGLDLPTVRQLLKCHSKAFRVDESQNGFPLPALPDGRRPVSKLIAQRGPIEGCDPDRQETLKTCVDPDADFTHVDERVHVYFAGLPGQEKVIAVMREESFPDDGKRQGAAIERDLVAKYGAGPDRSSGGTGGGSWDAEGDYLQRLDATAGEPDRDPPFAPGSTTRLTWLLDGRGQRMSARNPDFPACRDAIGFGGNAPSHLRSGCHRTVNAWITIDRDRAGIADGYGVAVIDQDAAGVAIDRTNAQVGALAERQRRRDQQRATANGGATAL